MSTSLVHRFLASAALCGGLLAAAAGSPYRAQHATVDVERLAGLVEREDDHVTAIELASWIRARKEGLRIIDLRSAEEFEAYHVPGAERVELKALTHTPFLPGDTIVLVSGGGAHAAQGWVFLQALGNRQTYFLRGGVQEWLDEVMSPTVAADATSDEKAAFAKAAELSRYFGGVPRVVPSRDKPAASTSARPRIHADVSVIDGSRATAAAVRRRGC